MRKPNPSLFRSGFTLIELSIALVIIGLVVGGILLGRDLIRAAELRSVVSDVDRIKTAVYTFKAKYDCLPGDCSTATTFWGAAAGGCPNGAGAGTQTCDGNDNGFIEGDWSGVYFETFRAWQQLENAGLITGHYTGVSGPVNNLDNIPGVNAYASRIGGAGFNFNANLNWWSGFPMSFSGYFFGSGIQFLEYGAPPAGGGDDLEYPALTPHDTYSIDVKIDDGTPGTGMLTTFKPSSGFNVNCATTSNPATAVYNTSYTAAACSFIVRSDF